MTEADLFRQVASSITKKKVHDIENAKSVFAEHLRNITKTWKSFSKFVKSQCEKQRGVDTQVLGLMIPKGEKIELFPSPDLMEVGKFKLPKYIRQMMIEENSSYEDLYKKLNQGLSALNFGSLASVCNLQPEQIKFYLTEIFSLLVEINRKTKQDVSLCFKNFGSLQLFKNGEIFFDKE